MISSSAAGIVLLSLTLAPSAAGAQCDDTRGNVELAILEESDSLMENNAHWGEFILPVPATISRFSSVMLTATSFDKEIRLKPPVDGFRMLKLLTLSQNVGQIAGSMSDLLLKSKTNMVLIKTNTELVHEGLINVTNYFDISQKSARAAQLNKAMLSITQQSEKSEQKVDEMIKMFDKTQSMVHELTEAIMNTFQFNKKKRDRIRKSLKQDGSIIENSLESLVKFIEVDVDFLAHNVKLSDNILYINTPNVVDHVIKNVKIKRAVSEIEKAYKAMDRVRKSSVQLNDLDGVINFLTKIFKDLNTEKEMWVEIKTFFIKFEGHLKDTGIDRLERKLGLVIRFPDQDIFLREAKKKVGTTLGMNFHIYRIALFYDKLLKYKLIKKLRIMSDYLLYSFRDPHPELQIMRDSLIEDAKKTHQKIKRAIMEQEKKKETRKKLLNKGLNCSRQSGRSTDFHIPTLDELAGKSRIDEYKNKDKNAEPDKTISSKDPITIPWGIDIDLPDIDDLM